MRTICRIATLVSLLTVSASAQLTPTFNDVQYGVGTLDAGGTVPLTLDIYRPTNPPAQPTPVVVWIHGGGWSGGNNFPPQFVTQMLNSGLTVASINYRLSGQAIFPAQIQDTKGAIRFLKANAATYGIDRRRIGAWGSSAGGHLTALLATSGGVAAADGNIGGNLGFSGRILAGVDYFGPTDLLNMNLDVTTPPGSTLDHDAPGSPESRLIGFDDPGQGIGVLRANQTNPNAPFPQLMELINLANPLTHVDPTDPVMFIAHGTNDTSVPIRQSTKLHDALTSAGVPHVYREVAGAGHGPLGASTEADSRAFLLAELTRPFGDADRNGLVNSDDFNILAANFGGPGGWRQGDFDANGFVNSDDFNLLAQNFGDAVQLTTLIPEPNAALVAIVGCALACRRTRFAKFAKAQR
jgi:acetyl esterase/lipase